MFRDKSHCHEFLQSLTAHSPQVLGKMTLNSRYGNMGFCRETDFFVKCNKCSYLYLTQRGFRRLPSPPRGIYPGIVLSIIYVLSYGTSKRVIYVSSILMLRKSYILESTLYRMLSVLNLQCSESGVVESNHENST